MASERDFVDRVRHALAAAEHGSLGLLDALVTQPVPANRGWALAASACRSLHGKAREPTTADVAALLGGGREDRLGAAQACVYLEKLRFLGFDAGGLSQLIDLHGQLAEGGPAETRLGLVTAELWRDVLRGDADLETAGRALHTQAMGLQSAGTVIEATVLRTLAALERGDQGLAVAHARRGSRMARTEGLVAHEWLAHLVLARVRRLTGKPHLALQILQALARVVTPPWHGWLGWELTLSGGRDAALPLLHGAPRSGDPAARAFHGLAELLDAADAGDRDRFRSGGDEVLGVLEGFRQLAQEAASVLAAIDARRPSTRAVDPWRSGAADQVPLGLQGLCPWTPSPEVRTTPLAFVTVDPAAGAARVLGLGVTLVPGGPQAQQEYAGRRAGQRTDVGLAVLALAGGDGLPADAFFERVWGFPFVSTLHRGALDMTVLRMRKLVAGFAQIDRPEGRLVLRASVPLVLADPRCNRAPAEQVLRLLARDGVMRAVEAAEALRVPLRTIQAALQQLVSDGACQSQHDGREVRYRVVDTTFTAITSA